MATCSACRAQMRRYILSRPPFTTPQLGSIAQTVGQSRSLLPSSSTRHASNSANAAKYKRADRANASKKQKKGSEFFKVPDLSTTEQWTLCDAMRYIRAFEVGQDASRPKYTLSVRLKTLKNGPVLRNIFLLPHPIIKKERIAVICPPGSKAAAEAAANGADLIGEDEIFNAVKEGRIEFERCLAHPDSTPKIGQSGIARILGPRRLMPSAKLGTVTKDIGARLKDLKGGMEYRERVGVVRLVVGQLGFTPEEMQANITAAMQSIKTNMATLNAKITKEIHEVVLASTNSPGFSLNGEFRSPDGLPPAAMRVL